MNVPKILLLKVRYHDRFQSSCQQLFGKNFSLQITDKGKILVGKRLYTRSGVNILAQGGNLEIGENVFMNHNVSITCLDNIRIGDGVTIANNVVIVDHDHKFSANSEKLFSMKPITISSRVWIGANSVILKGIEIGDGAVIAAGSVVTHSVEKHTLVAGVPARKIKDL